MSEHKANAYVTRRPNRACRILGTVVPVPCRMFLPGFAHHIQIRADVDGIRGWLSAVDPNDYAVKAGSLPLGERVSPSYWPDSVRSLRPRSVWLFQDGYGGFAVRLRWGGGFFHWGLTVGGESIETPPSDYDEIRHEIASDAYVWCR